LKECDRVRGHLQDERVRIRWSSQKFVAKILR